MEPNFLILGAAKSATTWIATELGMHPDIYLALEEIHYFSRHADRPWGWYEQHFAGADGALAVGERSNTYLYHPEAPARITGRLPSARLIVNLRHPVDRAYSGYCMQLDHGSVSERIADHLDPRLEGNLFLEQGLYSRHLERYREHFERSRLHVALFDDLVKDPLHFLRRLAAFLGCDPTRQPRPGGRRNARRSCRLPTVLSRFARWVEAPFALGASLHPPLPADLRSRLLDYFAADIDRLEELLERDLSSWRR